jgi:hypothetical protein
MTPQEIAAVKQACHDLNVEYAEDKQGQPLLMVLQNIEDAIAMRAFRKLIPYVADSNDQQLNADFEMLMAVYARNSKRAAERGYDEVLKSLGGVLRAAQKADKNSDRDERIVTRRNELLGQHKPEHSIAGILAREFELSPPAIRAILKKNES